MIVYAIVKYIGYSLWCYAGLRLLAGQTAPLRPALGFGAVRWLLGLGLGLIVFVASGSVDRSSLAVLYFGNAYGPPPPSVSTVAWGTLGSWLIPLYGWWIDRHRAAA